MAALKRFEVMVRKNSAATLDYLFEKYKRIMNDKQESDKNKDEDGKYIFIWYADIFDMRDGKNYKVFCDYAVELFEIADSYTTTTGEVIKGVMDANPYVKAVSGLVKTQKGIIA